MSDVFLTRRGGTIASLPKFTYTGDYVLIDDGNHNWRIKFLTSGDFTLLNNIGPIDVFLVGGGASGNSGAYGSGGGGGGGYTATHKNVVINRKQAYPIVVGAGANATSGNRSNSNAGGESSAFSFKAAGGKSGRPNDLNGGGTNGGSGGGNNGAGGSDGNNGSGSVGTLAKGQRNTAGPNGESGTTREFGEPTGDLYAGGGGGAGSAGGAGGGGTGSTTDAAIGKGKPNTGGGGAGSTHTTGDYGGTGARSGGSGIVIIRNARS